MIKNPKIFGEKYFYRCNKIIADFLIYDKNIPLMAIDKNNKDYLFTMNGVLEEVLERMPFYLKFITLF